jgi:flagellar biosynthesis protein FlhG
MVTERAPQPTSRAQRIVITSGKGGVGKTNIALNLGLALAQAGTRTVLLDADWGLSNAEVLLGISPRRDLRHVLQSECSLEDCLYDAPFGLKLIPGATGVAEIANLPAYERDRLLDGFARLGDRTDVMLLDTSPGIADSVIELAASADRVLVISTPEPTSLADTYAFVKVLRQRWSLAPIELVLNRVHSRGQAEEIAEGFSSVTERFLGYFVPLRGFVCQDEKVVDAVCRQSPLMVSYPRSTSAGCIRALAQELHKSLQANLRTVPPCETPFALAATG